MKYGWEDGMRRFGVGCVLNSDRVNNSVGNALWRSSSRDPLFISQNVSMLQLTLNSEAAMSFN